MESNALIGAEVIFETDGQPTYGRVLARTYLNGAEVGDRTYLVVTPDGSVEDVSPISFVVAAFRLPSMSEPYFLETEAAKEHADLLHDGRSKLRIPPLVAYGKQAGEE